jgi:WD40 repeat protein
VLTILVTSKKPGQTDDTAPIIGEAAATNPLPSQLQARMGDGVVNGIAYSPDGQSVAVASTTGLYLFSTDTFSIESMLDNGDLLQSVVYSPDGKTIFTSTNNNTVLVWDAESGALMKTITNYYGYITSIGVSQDGSMLATGSSDGTITLWNVDTAAEIAFLTDHSNKVTNITFSADGSLMASASSDNSVILWSMPDAQQIFSQSYGEAGISSLAFSPDALRLAVGSFDGTINILGIYSVANIQTLVGTSGEIVSMYFLADGKTLVSSSASQNTITLWSVDYGNQLQTFKDESSTNITYSTFSSNGL